MDGMNASVEHVVAALQVEGHVSPAQVERGRRAARQSGERLDIVLNKLGLVQDQRLSEAYARQTGIILYEGELGEVPLLVPQDIEPGFFRNQRVVLLGEPPSPLCAVVDDPLDLRAVEALRARLDLPITVFLAPRSAIETALARLVGGGGSRDSAPPEAAEYGAFEDIDRLKDIASEAPVIRLAAEIIEQAAELGASDIHITRSAEEGRVRLRVDGTLSEARRLTPRAHQAVVSRLKIMAGLDIGERRLPQDGRLQVPVKGREIDLRLSTMPHAHGEGAFLRILDRRQTVFAFDRLGFEDHHRRTIDSILGHAFGLFLITGPTGSGKTTTLYAALSALNDPSRHIVTVEDPIEYALPGVNQIQVNRQAGLDFARTLRSVLRQDPDIIMVGEIRDGETAAIAVQAALTGHFVLATLHTNDALSAVDRLVDMGVEPFLLSSVLRGVMAQRLVRRYCRCAAVSPDGIAADSTCPHCHGTGFSGRMPLAQVVPVTLALREAVTARASLTALERLAEEAGYPNLQAEGRRLVDRGLTSWGEVFRALGAGS